MGVSTCSRARDPQPGCVGCRPQAGATVARNVREGSHAGAREPRPAHLDLGQQPEPWSPELTMTQGLQHPQIRKQTARKRTHRYQLSRLLHTRHLLPKASCQQYVIAKAHFIILLT